MKTLITCFCLILIVGCAGVQDKAATPRPTVHLTFKKEKGLSVNANNVRFEDLVHAVFNKMVELEPLKVAPEFSMLPGLAERKVSMHIQHEMSRRKLFAALQEAGNCTMVVSADGKHAKFKSK